MAANDWSDFTEVVTRGKTHTFTFDVNDNITTWTQFTLVASDHWRSATPRLTLTLGAGIVKTDAAAGICTVTIAAGTSVLWPNRPQRLLCLITGVDATGNVWPLARGTLEVRPELTTVP
jgi:hypothetical protein